MSPHWFRDGKTAETASFLTRRKNELLHQNVWSRSLEIVDRDANHLTEQRDSTALRNLNLSNNLFTSIPAALPCLAENLSRLNMSYNSLRSMGHVTSYPAFLRQLDLSHNEISCWPSLVTINSGDPYLACYKIDPVTTNGCGAAAVRENAHNDLYASLCCHKKHLRLVKGFISENFWKFIDENVVVDNSYAPFADWNRWKHWY